MRHLRKTTKIAIGAGVALGSLVALFAAQGALRTKAITPARSPVVAAATIEPRLPAVEQTRPGSLAEPPPQDTTSPPASLQQADHGAPSCTEILGASIVEKDDPAGAYAQTQLGKRELVRGNIEAARKALCTASLWHKTNVERWLNLAQLFLVLHDGANAVQSAESALALQPANRRALTAAGDGWAMLGKVDEARRAYLAADGRADPTPEALRSMIQRDLEEAQRTQKRHDSLRAERIFRRILIFDPQNAAAIDGLATCLGKQAHSR